MRDDRRVIGIWTCNRYLNVPHIRTRNAMLRSCAAIYVLAMSFTALYCERCKGSEFSVFLMLGILSHGFSQ